MKKKKEKGRLLHTHNYIHHAIIYATGKNCIQVQIIQPRLILYFLCFLALIIQELGLQDKGNCEST